MNPLMLQSHLWAWKIRQSLTSCIKNLATTHSQVTWHRSTERLKIQDHKGNQYEPEPGYHKSEGCGGTCTLSFSCYKGSAQTSTDYQNIRHIRRTLKYFKFTHTPEEICHLFNNILARPDLGAYCLKILLAENDIYLGRVLIKKIHSYK